MPQIRGNPSQISQLFQNLLGNALKFRSATPLRIRIEAVRDKRVWQFSVADNGIGMDPRYSDRIFQMFQRIHERGRYQGSGIGLAITKKIVERHGGQIWFSSQLGLGTTFFFTIPAIAKQ